MAAIINSKTEEGQPDKEARIDESSFITEEEIRSFFQFQNISAEEINNIIASLHGLALISYDLFCHQELGNNSRREAA